MDVAAGLGLGVSEKCIKVGGAFQLVGPEAFYSLERQQLHMLSWAGPSSKSMTNYLEEKAHKDCTFEGLQRFASAGSRSALSRQHRQVFRQGEKKKIPLINDEILAWCGLLSLS